MTPEKGTYSGIFLLALVTLMFELVLTRVFSVSMWYHFAFMAISVAMFGMTAGAVLVYLFPKFFTDENINQRLTFFSVLYAVSIFLSTQIELVLPDLISVIFPGKIVLPYLGATYVNVSIPFVFSGICISLLLTKFEKFVGRLYAFDLVGAASGCVLLMVLLNMVDAFAGIMVMAALAALAGVCFALQSKGKWLQVAVSLTVLFSGMAVARATLPAEQFPLLRMRWVKFEREAPTLFEQWNSFSRITVHGDPNKLQKPFGWSLSPNYTPKELVNRLDLHIDGNAKTIMTRFAGDITKLDFLTHDLINAGHMLRENAKVLVIGVGSGRDILSALAFNQKSVLGVEVNNVILKALNQTFGDFSGHLDQNPKVKFVNDEARSFLARSDEKFDIIQISLIDTLAATSSGAFVFTENALYTIESWELFFKHLTDTGVLSVSRWYHKGMPAESYRITDLAVEALQNTGVTKPRDHILMAMHELDKDATHNEVDFAVATIVVSKTPFSSADVDKFEKICNDNQFQAILTPRFAQDETFKRIADGGQLKPFLDTLPLNVAAPTDDRPFFFHMLRLPDIFKLETWAAEGDNTVGLALGNTQAVVMLGVILATVIVLTATCIVIPLLMASQRSVLLKNIPSTVFFGSIGLGFLFVEISQMQRLTLLLGHPIYSLSVVLFSLLLASGLGSYTTQWITDEQLKQKGVQRLGFLLAVLIISGLITPGLVQGFVNQPDAVRVALSVLVLLPMGLFMGMAFPLGMRVALRLSPSLSPWLWGVNGALGVLASVLSMAVSLEWGISASFWLGTSCYVVAIIAYTQAAKSIGTSSPK
jgi:Spermidine synthase